MERKEKLEKLTKRRDEAVKKEQELLNLSLKETYETISKHTKELVDEIYLDLNEQADNPYQEELIKSITLENINLEIRFRSLFQIEGSNDNEEVIRNSFRVGWLWSNINKEGLYSVIYRNRTFIIYKNELESILNEYGLEFKPIKNGNYDYFTYEIKVNLKEHTLKYKK